MKATAIAPANIALIKFWGKRDAGLRLPMNSSISLNLSEIFTITTVEFDGAFSKDTVVLNGKHLEGPEKKRTIEHLGRIREIAGMKSKAKIVSKNNFPEGVGLASSASGFAALSLAGTKAAGLNLSERQLSILARLGSGSACRSIPDGWVEWRKGVTSDSSYAHSLYSPDYWDIDDVVVIFRQSKKKVSSTEGHAIVESSPFYRARIVDMDNKLRKIKKAITNKDFTALGQITEAEAVNMHAVMMTSDPALFYWSPETLQIILAVRDFREQGLEVYYTIDAGPNVHILSQQKDVSRLKNRLKQFRFIKSILINHISRGAHLI